MTEFETVLYADAAAAVNAALLAWRPLVIARLAEQVRSEIPDAYQVGFTVEHFDNGPFLTIQKVWAGDGLVEVGVDDRIDALRDLCGETLADLTTVFGSDLDELHLPDAPQPFVVQLTFGSRVEADAWLEKARFEAHDDEGSNDAEHDLLVEVIDTVAAALGYSDDDREPMTPEAEKRFFG